MSPVTQYVVQAAVTLLGIALLAFLVVAANRRLGTVAGRGPLELVGRLPLEGRRTVYLVRVNNRVLVLAATDRHITKLAELPDDAEFQAASQGSRFSDVLGRLISRPVASPATPAPSLEPGPRGERPPSRVTETSRPELDE